MSTIVFMVLFAAGVGAFVTVPFWAPHAIVWVMRAGRIYLFPEAIRLAVSLERDTAQWRFSQYGAEHPTLGNLRAHSAYIVQLTTKVGDDTIEWEPNFIERQIIWNALSATRTRLLRAKLDKVLP